MGAISSKKTALIILATTAFGLPLFFQNCSPVQFTTPIEQNLDTNADTVNNCTSKTCLDFDAGTASCSFNGAEVLHGQNVLAYLASSSGTCESQQRFCANGELSGSYAYATCTPDSFKSCLFDGTTIAHGAQVTAYQNGGGNCESENRICDDGVLSGNFQFSSCTPAGPQACLFNGKTVASGDTVVAFKNSSVEFGKSCESEHRLCTNGSMNGSYAHSSCAAGAAKSCLFEGRSVAHGEGVMAFQNSSVVIGQSCQSQERVCTDGVLSGTYSYGACASGVYESCSFNGATLAHGQKVKAYQSASVAFGSSCVVQDRSCNNGILSGSYAHASCVVGQASACSFNGVTLASGQSVAAFESSTVAFGQACKTQSRTCSNGALSGSYPYSSCAANGPQSCLFDGRTISHGSSVKAFTRSSVVYGESCSFENRQCNNGILSGSSSYASCTVQGPASCLFNGKTIVSGDSVKAFTTSSVAYGSACQSETRKCTNGSLNGSAKYASCEPAQAKSCTLNGKTVLHGASVKAYQAASVAWDKTCVSQTRKCDNGSLSGSYMVAACSVKDRVIKWVNINKSATTTLKEGNKTFTVPGETQAEACKRVGMVVSSNKGYGICASGEAKPKSGTSVSSISYVFGKTGATTDLEGGVTVNTTTWGVFCYRSGQKKDSDRTDLAVAYLCMEK